MLNMMITPQSATTATPASSQVPTTRTATDVAAKITADNASARMRRRPSSAFASGSCASTISTVLTKKTIPIPVSLTRACSFAKGGSTVEIWAYAAVTSVAITSSSRMNVRSRMTAE